jgi:outer membrane immunogenic protein
LNRIILSHDSAIRFRLRCCPADTVFFDPVRYTCAQRSWDGNKGIGTMKRTLVASVALFGGITSAAMAADLPPPMAPPPRAPAAYIPVAPAYNWSGFYIGGNLGAGFSKGTFSDTFGSTFNSTNSNTSFLGGGQVGVNYEFYNGVVIGAEAMFDWAPNTNNTITATGLGTVPNNSGTASAQLNNRWLTTATGKLGYAWDRVLLYGKGGWAWVGQSNSNVTVTPTGLGTTATSLSSNSTNSGWTAGVGVEWAFAGNWSARAEYDYIGLQNQTFTVASTAPVFAGDSIGTSSRSIQLVTAGLNYKFGYGWGGGWW